MRKERLLLGLLPLSILLGAIGLVSAACSSSSGSGGTVNDCYDYTSFDGTTPAVSFQTQVLPIFRASCGLSSSCHGCDAMNEPGCTTGGFNPFLGVSSAAMPGPLSTAQMQAIIDQTVGKTASTQTSSVDPPAVVGDPDLKIIAASDPQHSFMMYKLDGDPNAADPNAQVSCVTLTCATSKGCGLAMPSGGPQLPQSERDTIRRWIAQGAKNN